MKIPKWIMGAAIAVLIVLTITWMYGLGIRPATWNPTDRAFWTGMLIFSAVWGAISAKVFE